MGSEQSVILAKQPHQLLTFFGGSCLANIGKLSAQLNIGKKYWLILAKISLTKQVCVIESIVKKNVSDDSFAHYVCLEDRLHSRREQNYDWSTTQ